MGWKPVSNRTATRRTKRYFYKGTETKLRNEHGHEAIIFTANRQYLITTSKYMPHQGARECARRAAQ